MPTEYKAFTVEFLVDADTLKRLQILADATGQDVETTFRLMMQEGSRWDINEKLAALEYQHGIISREERDQRRGAWHDALRQAEGAGV